MKVKEYISTIGLRCLFSIIHDDRKRKVALVYQADKYNLDVDNKGIYYDILKETEIKEITRTNKKCRLYVKIYVNDLDSFNKILEIENNWYDSKNNLAALRYFNKLKKDKEKKENDK